MRFTSNTEHGCSCNWCIAFKLISFCDAPTQKLICFSFHIPHLLPWVHQTSSSYFRRSISMPSEEHPGMTGVCEIARAVISLLGGFIVLWFLLPTMLAPSCDKSELTSTNSHRNEQRSSNFSMAKTRALCAGMHTKIGDICWGIFKQWRTLLIQHFKQWYHWYALESRQNKLKKNSKKTKTGRK